jgi:Zn-dependent protease
VLGISALAVFTGVILHEVGHKLESLKVGIWAEYRKWDMGLLIAFLTSLFGFLFAAPGAVHIMGMGTRKDMERIAVGGIRVNMLLAAALLATFFILGGVGSLATILWFIASVNSYLALFNMLPIPPLDGFQLMRLNFPKYIVYLVGVGVLFAVIQMAFFLLAYI